MYGRTLRNIKQGHFLEDNHLGGAAIGLMFVTVTGFTPGMGLLTAVDTLAAQAVGAGIFGLVPAY